MAFAVVIPVTVRVRPAAPDTAPPAMNRERRCGAVPPSCEDNGAAHIQWKIPGAFTWGAGRGLTVDMPGSGRRGVRSWSLLTSHVL